MAVRSLRQRVSLKIGIAVAILVALVAIGQSVVFRATMELYGREIREQLVRPGIALAIALARASGADEAALRRDLGSIDGFCVAMYDAGGRLLARSRDDVAETREILSPELRAEADAAGGSQVLIGASRIEAPTIAIARVEGGGPVAYVGLFEREAAQTILEVRIRAAMGIVFLVVLVALGATALIAAWLRQQIQGTRKVVQRIAEGALEQRLPAAGDDEVGALVGDFNKMADRIEDLVETLRAEQEQKRRLFAAFTHEINTPLTSVLGYLESLRMDEIDADPETRRRYIAVAHEQAQALDALADDLETLSRLDLEGVVLDRTSFDLAQIVRSEAAAMGPRAAEAGIVLAIETEPVIADVDRRRLGQVLRNLIENAIRHSDRGSEIELTVRRFEGAPRIEVRDRGAGISPEDLAHVGEPLWRADPSRTRGTGGRGLGLAIARGIVEAHGGRLEIDSTLGKGTTVSVHLPRS